MIFDIETVGSNDRAAFYCPYVPPGFLYSSKGYRVDVFADDIDNIVTHILNRIGSDQSGIANRECFKCVNFRNRKTCSFTSEAIHAQTPKVNRRLATGKFHGIPCDNFVEAERFAEINEQIIMRKLEEL
jgi:hypothetical protein